MMRQTIKDVAIPLSTANLCLLGTWQRLVFANAADKFLMRDHSSSDFLAALNNVVTHDLLLAVLQGEISDTAGWGCSNGFLLSLGGTAQPAAWTREVREAEALAGSSSPH